MTPALQQPDSSDREQAFKQQKEDGEQMVHRLRNWSDGQIIWGYDVHGSGAFSGKTFTREGLTGNAGIPDEDAGDDLGDINSGHNEAREAYEAAIDRMDEGSVFLWVARIESVRQESSPRADPEPGLKFATLDKVQVVDSTYVPPTGGGD